MASPVHSTVICKSFSNYKTDALLLTSSVRHFQLVMWDVQCKRPSDGGWHEAGAITLHAACCTCMYVFFSLHSTHTLALAAEALFSEFLILFLHGQETDQVDGL